MGAGEGLRARAAPRCRSSARCILAGLPWLRARATLPQPQRLEPGHERGRHADQRAMPTAAQVVDGARGQLLAGAGFAFDQHRRSRRRDDGELIACRAQGRALVDEPVRGLTADLLAQAGVLVHGSRPKTPSTPSTSPRKTSGCPPRLRMRSVQTAVGRTAGADRLGHRRSQQLRLLPLRQCRTRRPRRAVARADRREPQRTRGVGKAAAAAVRVSAARSSRRRHRCPARRCASPVFHQPRRPDGHRLSAGVRIHSGVTA